MNSSALRIALVGLVAFLGEARGAVESVVAPFEEGGNKGVSVAPVVGYEPVYKVVVGGAFFYEATDFSMGMDANWNFGKVYQLHGTISTVVGDAWQIKLKSGVTKGFDPYFGEGGETNVANYERLSGLKWDNKLWLTRKITSICTLGVFADARVRTEEAAEDQSNWVRRFPNEMTAAFGVTSIFDTRKSKADNDSFIFMTNASFSPRQLGYGRGTADFGQLESSFVVTKEILKDAVPDVIAAFRVMGGYTFGKPTYLFKYRLGGANELPGYYDNRFRGAKYYVQQTEVRFPIWGMLGAAAFVGFGDATDENFTNAKMAYGGGLRIGLPPDYVNKIRIDVGVGRDQWGVFANFGTPF